jgi:hypothetical protein
MWSVWHCHYRCHGLPSLPSKTALFSAPSNVLLVPYFLKNLTDGLCFTNSHKLFSHPYERMHARPRTRARACTHTHTSEMVGRFIIPIHVKMWFSASIHLVQALYMNGLKDLLLKMYNACSWLVRPAGITANCTFNSTAILFIASVTPDLNWYNNNRAGFSRWLPGYLHHTFPSHTSIPFCPSILYHKHRWKFLLWVWSAFWIFTRHAGLCHQQLCAKTTV